MRTIHKPQPGRRHPCHESHWPRLDSGEARDMTKVYPDELWVVTQGSYSEWCPVAVFSTEALARAAIDSWNAVRSDHDEEYVIDGGVLPLDPAVNPKSYQL